MNKQHLLNNTNLKQFAIDSYTNPHCLGVEEFKSDFIKLLRLGRTIDTFLNDRDHGINVRIMLNTFIMLLNVFDSKALVRIAFFRLTGDQIPVAKTVFRFLNVLPQAIPEINMSEYSEDVDLRFKLEALA